VKQCETTLVPMVPMLRRFRRLRSSQKPANASGCDWFLDEPSLTLSHVSLNTLPIVSELTSSAGTDRDFVRKVVRLGCMVLPMDEFDQDTLTIPTLRAKGCKRQSYNNTLKAKRSSKSRSPKSHLVNHRKSIYIYTQYVYIDQHPTSQFTN